MCEAFIANHQFNAIKKQAEAVLNAVRTAADRKVIESVKSGAEAEVVALFPQATGEQLGLLREIVNVRTAEDYTRFTRTLEPCLTEFPRVTKEQLIKLFPKNKKLKLPDLTAVDYRYMTYLSWLDVSANKLFIVYPLDGRLVGVEGRSTPTNRKNYCFICHKYDELALFSAISKKRPANSSPDYYKAVGNYLCVNGHECNASMTDTAALESFIRSVLA